jgi:RimJ/RimL family protein N-acetyltransferase
MFGVLSDPAIYEFENSPPESATWLVGRFARLESRVSPDGTERWLNWVIRLPTGALAGYVQATIARDGSASIAYELASKFWRQGIGSAAVNGMLDELAVTYGVRTFVATLKERNHRSLALLRKLGFARAGAGDPDEIVMRKSVGTTRFEAHMNATTRVALIGDYDSSVPAHLAIPIALQLAGDEAGVSVELDWIPTAQIVDTSRLTDFGGLWCVPGSPYRSMAGALSAIRFARESRRPFLGTCGGFQHAIVEYARNVLGWADAEHAETAPAAARPVITPLACALVEATDSLRFRPGSRIASCYGRDEAAEGYRCRYGLNPEFQTALVSGPLRAGAFDAAEEIRAVELDDHPFFLATLFQPERAALQGKVPPVVAAFVRASAAQAAQQPHAAEGAVRRLGID